MAKSSKTEPKKPSGKPFPVVGIGASAGGLEAYKRILKAIPENSGMAYILVQHLDPTHESMLPDILSKLTTIPVHEVTDNINLAPDHIYIIPSNKLLVAKEGVLKLSPRPSKEIKNLPIDIFFKSLAEVHQNHAVGVVLSGTGTDGTLGLKAIKENGGISFAQDQQSAAYDGMPQSAIDAGVVDFVLAPEKIPGLLQEMNLKNHIQQDATGEMDAFPPREEEIFNQIISLLRMRRLVDFTYYKKNTLKRRISRRMAINKISQSSAYLDYLKNNKGELDLLFQDVLIPVTAFFRDTTAFEALRDKVYPVITKEKSNTESVRIWAAGCSTGEEAYSIAISLYEFLGDRATRLKIQIFATDISEKAITTARLGIYTKTQLEGVSDSRLQHFFTKMDGHFQVNKTIRDLVVFASHNMLKDPPFAKMDLISCRNVLIYMENFLQKKALSTFHYSLKDNGFLLLGKSETTGGQSDLFGSVEKHEKIFSKKDVPGRFTQAAAERRETNFMDVNKNPWKPDNVRPDFQKSADDILLQEYTPAGVVINEQLDIVHFRGDTGSYLTPSPGKPSLNLLKMAREGLGFELRNAIHKAKAGNSSVSKDGVPLQVNGSEKLVTIKVIPLPKSIEPHYLVLFQDSVSGIKPAILQSSSIAKDANASRIQRLERELSQAREDMRAITEDQEAVNEELQSANEELLSGNEEMQSLNEELETSKEELQSANEELTIVNQELFERNEIINDARKYSDSIIGTIREPLLILSKDMVIRTANKSFYRTFRITEQDTEGKLLYDLGDHQWDIPALRTMLQNIIPGKKEVSDFEITNVFPGIGERTMLLNARELQRESNREQLLLVAIEDITDRSVAEKLLKESETKFKQIADANIISIAFWNVNGNITDANTSFLNMLGYAGHELKEGKLNWRKLTLAEDAVLHQENIDQAISGKTILPYETHYIHKDGRHIPAMSGYSMLAGSKENGIAFIQDITQQKEAQQKIKESEQRYTKMLLHSPFAFAVLKGKDMVVTIANDAIKTVWGKGKELEGRPLLEILPEIKDQGFPELIDRVYKTGVPFYGHETLAKLKRDGIWEDVYFNFVYQPYLEADDVISGVTIIAYEVTIQAIANKKIKESGDQLRFMAEFIPQKVFTAKPTGEIDYFNPQWSEYTGISFEHTRDWGWLQFIHPDDIKENASAWQHSMNTGEPFMSEHRFRSKDGNYRWHLTRASALRDELGNIIKWFASSTDIHEAKTHIEEKFLLEFSEDFASYKTDEEFFNSLVNYIAQKAGMDYAFIGELKETKKDSFAIKTIALAYNGDMVPNIEYLPLDGPFEKLIRNTVYSHPKDCMNLFPENKTIIQYKIEGYVGYPLFDQDGKAMGLIAVMHKMEIQNHDYVCALLKIIAKRAEFEMERRIFNEKLKESNLRLENSNRNLSQYAYVASHDLQEPLRKIITFSNLMKERSEDTLNEVIEFNLEKIIGSAKRMKQLIQDLLNYSSLENPEESFLKTDLNKILQNVVKDFELRIEENDGIVKNEGLPAIMAVPLQMNQLFSNLLSNSLKFFRPGVRPIVNISYKTLTSAELIRHPDLNQSLSYCEIIFKDNGIGFSQKYAEQIFTIFQRLNARQEYPGTGIGLALCKKIAENHQGEIYAEAKEDKGAIFHIILPLE